MSYTNINEHWLFSGIGGAMAPPYKNFKSFASMGRHRTKCKVVATEGRDEGPSELRSPDSSGRSKNKSEPQVETTHLVRDMRCRLPSCPPFRLRRVNGGQAATSEETENRSQETGVRRQKSEYRNSKTDKKMNPNPPIRLPAFPPARLRRVNGGQAARHAGGCKAID
jgi:hypothetical protein